MVYKLMGYLHASFVHRIGELRRLAGERGQGTVEYVGLILLVSLLMVGMVAAMKGFNRYFSKTSHPKCSRFLWRKREAPPAFLPRCSAPYRAIKVERHVALRRPKPPRFPGPSSAPCI
ncbi:MAG TPA: hypothetical protein VFU11_07790 [Solirubrobacterales bacterium]|nr:hypothetical protein [Solirubrobacterales bacterium]